MSLAPEEACALLLESPCLAPVELEFATPLLESPTPYLRPFYLSILLLNIFLRGKRVIMSLKIKVCPGLFSA